MAGTQMSTQEAPNTQSGAKHSGESRMNAARRPLTDDEILGIGREREDAAASSTTGLKPPPASEQRRAATRPVI